jgi:hypothetical protein
MPLNVRIEPDLQVVFVNGEGVVTDEDLLKYVQEYLAEGDFQGYDEFFDLSSADLRDLTYAGLSSVAAAAAATDPEAEPTKIGILVSETLAKGLSRMYQSLRESRGGRRHARVFMDRAECREWLGLGS